MPACADRFPGCLFLLNRRLDCFSWCPNEVASTIGSPLAMPKVEHIAVGSITPAQAAAVTFPALKTARVTLMVGQHEAATVASIPPPEADHRLEYYLNRLESKMQSKSRSSSPSLPFTDSDTEQKAQPEAELAALHAAEMAAVLEAQREAEVDAMPVAVSKLLWAAGELRVRHVMTDTDNTSQAKHLEGVSGSLFEALATLRDARQAHGLPPMPKVVLHYFALSRNDIKCLTAALPDTQSLRFK